MYMTPITGRSQLAIPVNTTAFQDQLAEPLDVLADLIAECVLPRFVGTIIAEYTIDDRGHRVRAAIQKLSEHQGSIPQDQIQGAVVAFIKYLYSPLGSKKDGQRVIDVLFKPKQQAEDFGPLLSKPSFSLLGLQVSGEDPIGSALDLCFPIRRTCTN